MKSILFLLLCSLTFCANSFAQTDTTKLYFDKNWEETVADSAKFYSLRYQLNDSLWQQKDYYMEGTLQMSGTCTDADCENKIGQFMYYSKAGFPIAGENYFANGVVNQVVRYYKNGQADFIFDYHPETGKLISRAFYNENGEKSAFTPPQYSGGIAKMKTFISSNLKYPDEARKAGITGKVLVRFLIEKDGSISDLSVIKAVNPLLDNEAMRVISEMPKWIPRKRDGEALKIYFTLPVDFKLY